MMKPLLDVLSGCLNPSTVAQSEMLLTHYSTSQTYLEQLLMLVPNQQPPLLILVLSTIKNYLLNNYNNPDNMIAQSQKQILRQNILNMYYAINSVGSAVKLWQQIVHIVISVDYPWQGLSNLIDSDLNGNLMAAVYFSKQISKVYEYLNGNDRIPLQQFIIKYFPRLYQLAQQSLINFNENTAKLLQQILKTFYNCFHCEIPEYLRDFSNIDKWIQLFGVIMRAQVPQNQNNRFITSRIFVRLTSIYIKDSSDKQHKGWSDKFRSNYGPQLLMTLLGYLECLNANEQIIANIVSCLRNIYSNIHFKPLITKQHCHIIYTHLLPRILPTQQDLNILNKDQIQFIRRQQDLQCHPLRQSTFDLLEAVINNYQFDSKLQLMVFVQHVVQSIQSDTVNDMYKWILIKALSNFKNIVLKNKYFKRQFQQLLITYFMPLLNSNNILISSQVCLLLSEYLEKVKLSNQTVNVLMQSVYSKLTLPNIISRFYGILAFTALLNHPQALNAAKPHFQQILAIYVKILDTFDHHQLVTCLETIVSQFNQQIVPMAPNLINHLVGMFYAYTNSSNDQPDDGEEDDGNDQGINTLSVIKQILQSKLDAVMYVQVGQLVLQLYKSSFTELNNYFAEILTILNVYVYHTPVINQAQLIYLSVKILLQGPLPSLPLGFEYLAHLSKADSQYQQTLNSITKNLILKMPSQIIHKYPYPSHPELILALIQNSKLSQQQVINLNLSHLSTEKEWLMIIQSYICLVYGIGSVSDPAFLKLIPGVSLSPWINLCFGVQVVNLFLAMQEEQQEDDCEEEDTMQLLQKYANEDQNQDEDLYLERGVNYAYLYDGSFPISHDAQNIKIRLSSLSMQQIQMINSSLSHKRRKLLNDLLTT